MIEQFKFILFESIQSLKRYPVYSVISSLTIMICLIIISFIIYISNITNNLSQNFKNNEAIIKIFINNKIDESESKDICQSIKNDFDFDEVVFEGRQQLFQRVDNDLKKWLQDDINFMPCLCSANMSLDVIDEMDSIIALLQISYGDKIDRVVYPQSYLIKFEKILSMLQFIIFIIGVIILVISIFNVSNVIKLSIESRKDVIEILKLHGAQKYFIKSPFIIEGMIHGLIGFIFSSIIIAIIFNIISLDNYNHFLVQSIITTIPLKIYIFLNLIFGTLLGLVGSNLGLSNYLE
mgnify:FL=1|tara:strand:+ start:1099 stop:1977 length:879 start_codon:yes stop_codon:yes gene_type:complete